LAEDLEEREEDAGTLGSERVVSFSDGVFAIAITLLVLGLEVPNVADDQLGHALSKLGSQAFSYFIGFAVMGLFWIDHHRFFARLRAFDGTLLVLNLAYLSLVALMPFTTGVFGRYGDVSIAVALYAGNVAATSLMSVAMRVYAERRRLLLPGYRQRPLWRSLLPAAVFLVSIPVAFVSPRAAPYVWLALLGTSFARRVQTQG
jgi:TMEM175 potassium channel family protein